MRVQNDEGDPLPAPFGKGQNIYVNVSSVTMFCLEEGHITATLIHLANTSYRLGRTLKFDPVNQTVIGDEEANRYLRGEDRGYRKPFTIPDKV
jgi:hypothetical protein